MNMKRTFLPIILATLLLATAQAAKTDQGMTLEPIASSAVPGSTIKEGTKGFRVGKVEPGSPADKAGMKEGDVILQIDGKPIEDYKAAHKTLRQGGEFVLSILRDNKQAMKVTLKGEKRAPKEPKEPEEPKAPEKP